MVPKTGPLTAADLQAIWESTTDPGFWRALEQAGEGNGFEVYTQAWQQMARVSQAIDLTTQAMYVLPWSGQTSPSAQGGQQATVTISISRTLLPHAPLILAAGTFVDEVVTDWSYDGGIQVATGRRYALSSPLVIAPGTTGPIAVSAQAERIGYGYNNPPPGTITSIDQAGSGYSNVAATVRLQNYPFAPVSQQVVQLAFIDALDEADAFLPQHVGQYLQFTAGANAGTIARIISYAPPNLSSTPPTGGTLGLAFDQSVRSNVGHFSGTFLVGESLVFTDHTSATVGYGVLLDATTDQTGDLILTFIKTNGALPVSTPNLGAATVSGLQSLATATVDLGMWDVEFVAESVAAAWRILDWVVDWGAAASNPNFPSGGRAAMLDALGKEKNISRRTGEADPSYARRIAQIADVVSPNAILRAINSIAVPGGFSGDYLFLEAGTTYPGFYFDQDAYDLDAVYPAGSQTGTFLPGERVVQQSTALGTPTGPTAQGRALVDQSGDLVGIAAVWGLFSGMGKVVGQTSQATFTPTGFSGGLLPQNQFRVWFDYEDMRAWFYVILPAQWRGDYGFAYDTVGADFVNAWDAPLASGNFYDGEPLTDASTYSQLWANLDGIRAGGVGVTFQLEQ